MVTSRNAALTVAMILGLISGGCASSNPTYGGGGSDGGADLVQAAPDLARGSQDLSGQPVRDMATGDLAGVALLSAGDPCNVSAQCQSMMCQPVGPNGAGMCLQPCKTQADCTPYSAFCEPAAVGGSTGFCIPPSPYHCSTCTQNSDCGVLTEVCAIGTGDNTLACHIDCSLDATACPPDYQCAALTVSGTARKLCLPTNPTTCLDALGGYCGRVSNPQTCSRTNVSGSCVGQRTCLASGRYNSCGAAAPAYLPSCVAQNPAGCMEAYQPGITNSDPNNCGLCGHACAAGQGCCTGVCTALNTTSNCGTCGTACAAGSGCCTGACAALNTTTNCGTCGTACPASNGTNDFSCVASACNMTCRGENYDVNNSTSDGCERLHPVPPGHTKNTAGVRPQTDCNDGDSQETFSNPMYSDSRVHNPAVDQFSGTVGNAPDWWSRYDTGGTFCEDDYSITFSTSGGGATKCYMLTFVTNNIPNGVSVTVSGSGSASMSGGSGSYSDDSTVYFEIQKICSLPVQEAVTYTVNYHL